MQGARAPYAVRWYGVTSLFGHFRNFIARAIASESVDSRDWMRPLEANELLARAIRVLGGDDKAPSLVEALGRPMWLDFVADTGDDRDVSHAVGKLIADTYTVDDAGTERTLPRGELLLHAEGVSFGDFSPDGRRVVTTTTNGAAMIWDVATHRLVARLRGHATWISRASFSPDGLHVATASKDGSARIWTPES